MNHSHTPLYYRIKTDIIEKIHSGEFQPDQQLPTESEFCEKYGVSKAPVRQALTELSSENYIYTIRGKGSFVLSGYVKHKEDKLCSFSDEIRAMGYEPGTIFIGKRKEEADPEVAKALGINVNDRVLKVIRLRLISGEIYSLNYSYFSLTNFPELDNVKADKLSLSDEVSNLLNAEMLFANVEIEATTADEKKAEYLQLNVGAPLLKMSRTTFFGFNQIKRPVEYSRVYFVPDKYKYEVTLYR